LKKNRGIKREASNVVGMKSFGRAILYLVKIRSANIDAQATRKKLNQLDGLFELADSRGNGSFQQTPDSGSIIFMVQINPKKRGRNRVFLLGRLSLKKRVYLRLVYMGIAWPRKFSESRGA
jgi:hypothetical protein